MRAGVRMRPVRAWAICGGLALCVSAGPGYASEGFEAQLKAAQQALAARDLGQARGLCREAERTARAVPNDTQRAEAAALCGRIELVAEAPQAAVRHFRRAARASVARPKLRRKLLAQRRQAAQRAKMSAEAKAVTELLQHDLKVQGLLRRSKKRGPSVERATEALMQARKAYRADGDAEQARLADATRALVLSQTDRRALGQKLAEGLLQRPRSDLVTQTALRALFFAHTAAQETVEAAEAAIELDQLRLAEADDGQRRYSRGWELQQACRGLDGKEGAGTCARLQLSKRGFVALVDYSKRKHPGRLTQAQLDAVHADALVSLEHCVLALAKADPDRYRDEELTFGWTIGPDGKPAQPEVRPRRHQAAAQQCIDEAVVWFRYPQTPASVERTNVSVPYRLQ